MNGLFFTGTDTGVGKTFLVAAVAQLWRQQGRAFAVCKPVATGAVWLDGRWVSDDTRLLAEAAGVAPDWDQVTTWAFPDPVAPPVAARRQGQTLALPELAAAVRRCAAARADLVLVEGVGGLLCPLTERATVADWAALLGLPLVIVARRSLGTLNHTLLTLEVARGRGLVVAGVVVNATEPPRTLAEETNVEELRRRIAVPLLAVVPYHTANEPRSEIAAVDWRGLCQ